MMQSYNNRTTGDRSSANAVERLAAMRMNDHSRKKDHSLSASPADNRSSDDRSSKVLPNSFRTRMVFQSPFGACNFIVTWDGEDVRELLDAIQFARRTGDRFIQDKLIEYVLSIPFRNPRPSDIPAFIGKPVWAVDKHGRVLIGMPGSETIMDAQALREQMGAKHPGNA